MAPRITRVHAAQVHTPQYAVVFVHGIGGDEEDTWLNRRTGHRWYESVAAMHPHWEIFLVGYDSAKMRRPGSKTAVDQGLSLTSLAREVYHQVRDTILRKSMKIVFVCHSMGGLIVKEFFRFSEETGLLLAQRCGGILFLGTPHYGAHVTNQFESLTKIFGSEFAQAMSGMSGSYLHDLDEDFRRAVGSSGMSIVNLVERKLTMGLRIVDIEQSLLIGGKNFKNFHFQGDHIAIAAPATPLDIQSSELSLIMSQVDVNLLADRTLFCHFYDHHLLEWHGWNQYASLRPLLLAELDALTRIGVFLFDCLLVPASCIFELDVCRAKILEFTKHFPGIIRLFGEGWDLEHYTETAKTRFVPGDRHYQSYELNEEVAPIPFVARQRSATREVMKAWRDTDPAQLLRNRSLPLSDSQRDSATRNWASIIDELEGKAFMAEYIVPKLIGGEQNEPLARHVQRTTGDFFYESTCGEFASYIITNLDRLSRPLSFAPRGGQISLNDIRLQLEAHRVSQQIRAADLSDLAEYANSARGKEVRASIRAKLFHIGN